MPKGMRFHSYNPSGVMNARYLRVSLCTGICQYALSKSNVEKYFLPCRASKAWCIRGKGYAGNLVTRFRGR